MPLYWKGDRVRASVQRASVAAINTMVEQASSEAADAWPIDTGLSQESIGVIRPAQARGTRVTATWGAKRLPASPNYSSSSRVRVFFNEVGVEGKPGLNIMRRSADIANRHLARQIRIELAARTLTVKALGR